MFCKSLTLNLLAVLATLGAGFSNSSDRQSTAAPSQISSSSTSTALIQGNSNVSRVLERQGQLLKKIHRALLHGFIMPTAAADLERRVMRIEDCLSSTSSGSGQAEKSTEQKAFSNLKELNEAIDSYAAAGSLLDRPIGTTPLQDKLTGEIDTASKSGTISKADAQQFVTMIDRICAEEAWFLSNSQAIPLKLLEQDNLLLNGIDSRLVRALAGAGKDHPM